jgi:3-hydroxybutyryl-CoA dehydrogenase
MNRTARAPDLARIATVGVVGAGFMGAQLALHIATRGYPVAVVDQSMDALGRMRRGHEEELDRRLAAEALSATERTAVLERIRASSDLAASFGNVDLVIEAVPERLDLKRAVFEELDRVCPPGTILATNSSSIRISHLEDATGRPDRVLNAHFYPPVWQAAHGRADARVGDFGRDGPTRRSVREVCRPDAADGAEGEQRLCVQSGLAGDQAGDAPPGRRGVASVDDVDRAWMICWEMPIGPFGVMDVIGLDVVLDIEQVYYAESGDPRDAPPRLLIDKVAAGELGVKAGRGFYRYPHPAYQDPAWRLGEADDVTADVTQEGADQ